MTNNLKLMALFAHPDDEAFGSGGTLSKYAREGIETHLVTATLGAAGQIANPDIKLDAPLSVVRERELRHACEIFGVSQLHLLGYQDGQMTVAPQSEAVYRIVKLMRRIRPDVVLTYGPDGSYGHYDHLAIHRWATAAVQISADAEWWPDAGEPYEAAKLYYRAMPNEQVAKMREMFGRLEVMMDGIPFPFTGYPMSEITTIIDIRDHIEAKVRGIRAHATQVSPDSRYWDDEFDWLSDPFLTKETYRLIKTRSDISIELSDGQKETDFFAGLR